MTTVATQVRMYYDAERKAGEVNATFLELVKGGMTREELARNIERRPSLWARFENWLTKLPTRSPMADNYAAINEKRRMALATAENARINDEARVANELQAATGCNRTAALVAAKIALSHCANHTSAAAEIKARVDLGGYLVIRCASNANFLETWSDTAQARERCDELNRDLDHPAYFIA
jgi:hypothetical protein